MITDPSVPTSPEPALAEAVGAEIYDQMYHLSGTDPAYIQQLAAAVDEKMRAVAAQSGTADSLRVAVLAALNIADELATLRRRYNELAGTVSQSQRAVRSRTGTLSHLLEEAIDDPTFGSSIDERRVG